MASVHVTAGLVPASSGGTLPQLMVGMVADHDDWR
jgi:hypothetical protein